MTANASVSDAVYQFGKNLRDNSCAVLCCDRELHRSSTVALGVTWPEHGELQMLGGFSRGLSKVLERRNHLVTLGWSDRSQGLLNGLTAPVGDGLNNLCAAIGQA